MIGVLAPLLIATVAADASDASVKDAVRLPAPEPPPLLLRDFAPRSMLRLPAHEGLRPRFPVVDFHQHTNDRLGEGRAGMPPAELVAHMDAANVRTLVILTGKWGDALSRLHDALVKPYPGRFVVFTQIDFSRVDEPDFGAAMAAQLRDSVARGARGLKVRKELGLGVRGRDGKLVAVDDPRFDPIWAECGRLGVPIAIHTGDPEAFFHPVDGTNERYEELVRHPGWSFHGKDFPSLPELLAAQERVVARHPETIFVSLHVGGWPENLDQVSAVLDRRKNLYVDIAARAAELGRQPRRARAFFLRHADRILFGTDASFSSEGRPPPLTYAGYARLLETADEYFPYGGYPAQGRWHVYGLDLPPRVLEKVYHRNAERVFAAFRGDPRAAKAAPPSRSGGRR